MESKKSTTNIMLTYGLYLGIAEIVLGMVNYSFGDIYEPHFIVKVITYLLVIVFIVLGLKSFKSQNNGLLKLGTALKVGTGIALVSAIIGIIFYWIFVKFIEPEFTNNMLAVQERLMIEKRPDASDEEIEMGMKFTKRIFTNPFILSSFILLARLILGFIVALIAGLIMKKDAE